MLISFIDRASQVAIAGRVSESRRPQRSDDFATVGDLHLPFSKFEARTEAAKWFSQAA